MAAHSGPRRTPTPEAACMASSAQKTGPQTRGWQFIHVLWAAYAKYSIQTSCTAYMVCTCTLNTNGIGMKGAWHVSCSHAMHVTQIRVESPLPRQSSLDCRGRGDSTPIRATLVSLVTEAESSDSPRCKTSSPPRAMQTYEQVLAYLRWSF